MCVIAWVFNKARHFYGSSRIKLLRQNNLEVKDSQLLTVSLESQIPLKHHGCVSNKSLLNVNSSIRYEDPICFLKRISVQHTGSRKHTSQAKKRQAHKQKHTSKPSNIRQVFVCGRRACAALAARVRQPHYTDLWAEPRQQQQQQQALNVKSAAEARLQQCSSLAADNNMEDMLRLSRPELEVEQLNCLTEQPQTD